MEKKWYTGSFYTGVKRKPSKDYTNRHVTKESIHDYFKPKEESLSYLKRFNYIRDSKGGSGEKKWYGY